MREILQRDFLIDRDECYRANTNVASIVEPKFGVNLEYGRAAFLKWLILAIFAPLCVLRLRNFTPQPLDSAGTLRPILYRWWLWFVTLHVHPEQAFSSWSTIAFIALMIPVALTIANYSRRSGALRLPRFALKVLCSRALLFGSIAVCLFVCRYPILLDAELNPDEGQFIASAHKLFYDSNFFRSVDCGTSGPLNIYPLMLPAIFGLSPDYASSRVIALILVLVSIYVLYRTCALIAEEDLARIAILPAVLAFATFKHRDLVHYSSEHVPLLLTALSLYAVVRVLRRPQAYHIPVFLLGAMGCAAFFAKMQAVPIVVAIAAVAIAYLHASGVVKIWKPALLFVGGILPLAAANAALCLLTGVWPDFVMAYLVTNNRYADFGGSIVTELPRFVSYLLDTNEVGFLLLTLLALAAAYAYERSAAVMSGEPAAFLQMAGVSGAAVASGIFVHSSASGANYAYVLWIAMLAIPGYLVLFYRKRVFGTESLSWLGALAIVSLAAALFAVYKAHRPFPHYLLLIILPVCTAMAWMLIRQVRSGSSHQFAFVSLFLVLTIVYGCYQWGSQDDQAFKRIPYTLRPLEGNLIRAMTAPEARIVVWGWTVRPYLGSGRVPATRDTNMANFFRWPEISNYYRERFVRDLKQHPAELFIDAVGPTSWAFNDKRFNRFQECPEIKAYIDEHYTYLADLYEQRYYLRRDLVGKRRLPFAHDPGKCEPGALRCVDTPSNEPRQLKPIHMPGHAVVQIEFTPTAPEPEYATVFSNERAPGSYRGFQFFHIGGETYRLALGLGSDWAFSKDMVYKQGASVSLWVELNGNDVTIYRNLEFQEQMHLPRPMVDSDGEITLGAWMGQRRFIGEIHFFQISDQEKPL